MFGRSRRASTPAGNAPTQGGMPLGGVHAAVAVVADPDASNIARQQALFADRALGLQGHSGYVVGYDQGDPAHSYTGIVDTAPANPIQAVAELGIADEIILNPNPGYTETPTSDSVAMSNYLQSKKYS